MGEGDSPAGSTEPSPAAGAHRGRPGYRWAAAAGATVASLLLAARVAQLYRPYLVVDDAFISFRYAANLAHGHGLVYNPGERVEGYSNFLWTVLIAAGLRLGGDPVAISICLNALAALATIALLTLWSQTVFVDTSEGAAERFPLKGLLAVLPPLLFAADGAQARYILSGMETQLFVVLVLAGIVTLLVADRPLLAGVVFAFAAATRFEGLLFTVLAVTAVAWPWRGASGAAEPAARRGKRALRLSAAFLALWLPYFVVRWSYYGYPLPNTYYAKAGGFEWSRLGRGVELLVQVVGWWAILPLLALALCALPALRRSRTLAFCWVTILATTGSFVFFGGDFLDYFGPRFLMPAFPLLLLAATAGLGLLATLLDRGLRPLRPAARRALLVTFILLIGLGLALNAIMLSWPARSANLRLLRVEMESWDRLGKWIATETPPDSVLAVGAAGAAPYYSHRVTIDMYGLADAHIAHRAPLAVGYKHVAHEHFDPHYVLDRHPDLLLSFCDRAGVPRLGGLPRMVRRVRACYRPLLVAWEGSEPPPDGRWLLPTRKLDPELWDRGYRTTLFELRRGRGVGRCEAVSREGSPPSTAPTAPSLGAAPGAVE